MDSEVRANGAEVECRVERVERRVVREGGDGVESGSGYDAADVEQLGDCNTQESAPTIRSEDHTELTCSDTLPSPCCAAGVVLIFASASSNPPVQPNSLESLVQPRQK